MNTDRDVLDCAKGGMHISTDFAEEEEDQWLSLNIDAVVSCMYSINTYNIAGIALYVG